MALKLDTEYTLTLDNGGSFHGEVVEFPADSGIYCVKVEVEPSMQNLTATDGVRITEAQGLLRQAVAVLTRLTELEDE